MRVSKLQNLNVWMNFPLKQRGSQVREREKESERVALHYGIGI